MLILNMGEEGSSNKLDIKKILMIFVAILIGYFIFKSDFMTAYPLFAVIVVIIVVFVFVKYWN